MEESQMTKNYDSQSISVIRHVPKGIVPYKLNAHDFDYYASTILVYMTNLVIKTIDFQIITFISFFTFPISMMYYSFMFVVDPFRMLRWARNRAIRMLLTMWGCFFGPFVPLLNGHKALANLLMRVCWGLFWAMYVCFLLFGLLITGFVIGGVTMRYVVEEPIQRTENLNFDYTKSSPVALVPIMACPTVSCGINCRENIEVEKYVGTRVIPPNHKLQLGVSLTLPESDYNQKLGIFQVRVEYISATGEVTASPSYPCMLRFKSQLIRFVETFLRSLPLLAGYSSESQTLHLKMTRFTEGNEPISCLKVILQQRAEYRPTGTGMPEIYGASLELKSELSVIKKMVWYWRRVIFIWLSMASFMMELMVALICCRPIIMPRARARHGSKKIDAENILARIKGD